MPTINTWEKHEIALRAENKHENSYMDVTVGVRLRGPAFKKKVYGFWDGDNVFRVRVIAMRAGSWN
jgi:hypothetical protein